VPYHISSAIPEACQLLQRDHAHCWSHLWLCASLVGVAQMQAASARLLSQPLTDLQWNSWEAMSPPTQRIKSFVISSCPLGTIVRVIVFVASQQRTEDRANCCYMSWLQQSLNITCAIHYLCCSHVLAETSHSLSRQGCSLHTVTCSDEHIYQASSIPHHSDERQGNPLQSSQLNQRWAAEGRDCSGDWTRIDRLQ
jgi:hypothetical protein